jgi:hypothetical protein
MADVALPGLAPLEEVLEDEAARRIFLKLAALAREGRIGPFLDQLDADTEVDDETKRMVSELGRDEDLLLTVEDYLRRTHRAH